MTLDEQIAELEAAFVALPMARQKEVLHEVKRMCWRYLVQESAKRKVAGGVDVEPDPEVWDLSDLAL